jgi:hypothetical protein
VIEVEMNVEQLNKKFDALIDRIKDLPRTVPVELTAWQNDDMRRARPNTDAAGDQASTMIWPRSRLELEGKRPPRARYLRRNAGRRRGPPQPRGRSSRPILRPELFEKLCERMMALLKRTMKWA